MKVTEGELQQFDEAGAGYCPDCDQVTRDSGVEPDAEDYRCPRCNNDGVMGMQQAVLLEKIDIR